MAKIKNVSGHDLIVPGLGGRLVPEGAVVDCPDEDADSFTVGTSMWVRADVASAAGDANTTKGRKAN